jgi:hypothetical protein
MQKPNPNAAIHKRTLESGMMITTVRVDRQMNKAARTIYRGPKRVATGMEIRRPRVKDSQKPDVR